MILSSVQSYCSPKTIKQPLAGVMAWCHEATSRCLSQFWQSPMIFYDVIREQRFLGCCILFRSRVISDEQSLHSFAHAATAMLSLWVWVHGGLIVGKDITKKQIFRRLRVDGGNVHRYLEVFLRIVLMHWGRVTHIWVISLIIIGSDNGLSLGRRQTIIWTNAVNIVNLTPVNKIQWNVNRN